MSNNESVKCAKCGQVIHIIVNDNLSIDSMQRMEVPNEASNEVELTDDTFEALFQNLREDSGKWNAENHNRNDGTLTFGSTVFVRARK